MHRIQKGANACRKKDQARWQSYSRTAPIYLAAAFLLLCILSAYMQIGKRLYPADPIRPVIIYFAYTSLLAIWWAAIHSRVTQRNIRVFLSVENILMLFGMTIRFIQEAFWNQMVNEAFSIADMFLARFSGYCTNIAFILIPLIGLYASFGLGKTEEYRFDRRLYALFIPAILLALMVLTNDLHNFVYQALQDEAQNFRYYRPNIGFYLFIAWAFSLLFVRILILYRKSREPGVVKRIRLVPLFITVMLILVNIPHIVTFFLLEYELLGQEVTLFFLEILVWESCILIGMVPVNTHYDEVFDRSTVAMRIVDESGRPYLNSTNAPELSEDMFDLLKQKTTVRTHDNKELHLHKIRGGYSIWQSDVSRTIAVIDELQSSAEKLELEGELLRQEMKTRSDEAAVKEQLRIYNQLTKEVGGQLALLSDLLEERELVADKTELFKKICVIGTYIKRRCNLRLIEQSDGSIQNKDLELCYHDLAGCLRQMDVEADVLWNTTNTLAPEFAIFTVDAFEFLLEYERFELQSIIVAFEIDATLSIQVHSGVGRPEKIPLEELRRMNRENFDMRWKTFEKGYQVFFSNGRY